MFWDLKGKTEYPSSLNILQRAVHNVLFPEDEAVP
jgi:hypothetical protein